MHFFCITQINRNKIFNNIPIILQLIESNKKYFLFIYHCRYKKTHISILNFQFSISRNDTSSFADLTTEIIIYNLSLLKC